MRAVLVGDYPLNDAQIRGGVQAAFSYLVKELCQIDDLQVHVLTLASSKMAGQVRSEKSGATLHFLPPFPRFELAKRFSTYQAQLNYKLDQIDPDVVHAQGTTEHAYVALRSGYPAIITVHGIHREDSKYKRSLRVRLRNWIMSVLIERYNLRHTRHLIAISHYVTDYFSRLLHPDAQIYYIPNAIDGSFFNLKNCSGNGQTVLFAGRVIQRKRVLDLVKAFAQVAQRFPLAQLRIAGECHSEKDYVKLVRDFIRDARLTDNVHLLGALSEEEVLREFASCDLLALPSAQETTPMVIAQAMAAGKPVIATPVGGVAEMVRDGETGLLFKVNDIKGLADALLQLLKNPSLRTHMGKLGHKFAVEHYRADNVAKHTHNAYCGIVKMGRQ
jgi:glycosyltransferase involved in cell wall biosynthesis